MSKPEFGRLFDSHIINAVKDIQKESYDLKKAIFKSNLMGNDISRNNINQYLTRVNDFLKYWDEYSEYLMKTIKRTNAIEGTYSIEYQWVKEMIYAKFDYASILPFVDGIIKGISSGKFEDQDAIEDFKDHTISKAFKDLPTEIGALVDSFIDADERNGMPIYSKCTATEAKLFNSIRSYAIFNPRDRKELYKAISISIEFIIDPQNLMKYFKPNNTKMFISVINNIMDYITYSMVVYACRVYSISSYAFPFIDAGNREFSESVTTEELKAGPSEMKYSEINILRNTDDMICRDPDKTKEFIDIFNSFIKQIGAETLIGSYKPVYTDSYQMHIKNAKTNKFCSQLESNALFSFLNNESQINIHDDNMPIRIKELNQIIKEFIFNSDQGIQGTSSPKQELFHVIRGTTCDNNLKSYQELAIDLYFLTFGICGNIKCVINTLTKFRNSEREYPKFNTGVLNIASESVKIMTEFYRDIMTVISQKARDIEMKINELRSKDIDNTLDKLKLDVDLSTSTNNNMMVAVPDTTRIPMNLMDIYDSPTFESLELYDEYVKYTLNAYSDMYFSEAFNIGNIVNTIISKIAAAIKRLQAFWNDKTVQHAFKWVRSHEQELLSMDFSAAKIEKVVLYKKYVQLPKNFNNLSNNLKTFTEKNISTPEETDKFIKSLYPDDIIYNWFNGEESSEKKNGATLYKNFILYYDINEVKEQLPGVKELSGAALSTAVKDWIVTVKGIETTVNGFSKIGNEINSGINIMKNKLTSISNNPSSNVAGSNVSGAPDISKIGNEENKPGTTPNQPTNNNQPNTPPTSQPASQPKKEEEKNNNNGSTVSGIVTKVSLAVDQLYVPLQPIFVEYIKAMYKYLQEAYTMGRKK